MNYLEPNEIIDFDKSTQIRNLSGFILSNSKDETDFIKNAFEYVRDNISHSADISGKIVTCKASEVLTAGEGICYAKSHLLAALLRSCGVQTGFCYQRLILDDENAPYLVLHGLNAVYISEVDKWIRLDARGNKPGVDAQFSLYDEKLAFTVRTDKGEEDIPDIFAKPDINAVNALTCHKTLEALWANLPGNIHKIKNTAYVSTDF